MRDSVRGAMDRFRGDREPVAPYPQPPQKQLRADFIPITRGFSRSQSDGGGAPLRENDHPAGGAEPFRRTASEGRAARHHLSLGQVVDLAVRQRPRLAEIVQGAHTETKDAVAAESSRTKAKIRLRRAVTKAAAESKLRKALEAINAVVVELCDTVKRKQQPLPTSADAGKPRLSRMQYKLQWAATMVRDTNKLKHALKALKDEVDATFLSLQEKKAHSGEDLNPCDVSPRFIRRTLMTMGPHIDQVAKAEIHAVQHSLSSLTTSVLSKTLALDSSVRGGLYRVVDLVDASNQVTDTRPAELFEPSIRSLAQMDTEVFQAAVADMISYASSHDTLDTSDRLAALDAAIEHAGFTT